MGLDRIGVLTLSPTLVVLAAGAGRRFGGAKQLEAIGPGGEMLLEYSVYDALRAGFGRVVLVVRPEVESRFRERFEGGMDRHVEIGYAHQRLDELPAGVRLPVERSKPWGTGHAVLAAREHVDGPFAVINADDLYGSASYVVLRDFLASSSGAASAYGVVGFPVADTLTSAGPVSRALCEVDGDRRLRKIVELASVWSEDGDVRFERDDGERGRLRGDELVSMNMWGFGPAVFSQLERQFEEFLDRPDRAADRELLLPEVIQSLVAGGDQRVEVLRTAGEWSGVTFRDDMERVAERLRLLVERGGYPKELWR